MSQAPTPTIEDYKKYTRELKVKIKRLQEKNKELVTENVQVKHSNAKGDSDMSKIDFAVTLNKKVIRAQALWRGILARRNFKRVVARLSKGEAPKQTPNTNQFVMIRAKEAAEKIGLSLEMLYRAADMSSQGQMTLEDFKLFLKKIKLKLAPAQLTRFLFLVDEDCSGTVTKEDFYTTLAAYGVNTERLWAHDSSRTYEQQCLLKFAKAIKQNGYSKEEVLVKCDPKGSGTISLSTISQFIDSNLRIEFKEREKFALSNYLDVNKTNSVETKHLGKELDKAFNINVDQDESQTVLGLQNKRDFGSRPAVGEQEASSKEVFRTDLYSTGEQGIAGQQHLGQIGSKFSQGIFTGGKPQSQGQGHSTQGRNPASSLSDNEADTIQSVVNKIQKVSPMGRFLLEVLNICEIDDSGYINLDDLNRYISTRYGSVLTIKDRTTLIKAMDTNKNHRLDLFELRNFFKAFSNKNATFMEFSLRILAKSLDKMMISTSDFLIRKKVDLTGRINFEMFCNILPDLIKADDRECAALFKEIDNKNEGSITPRQLIEVVNGYRTESFKEFYTASSKLEKKQKDKVDMTREGRDFQQVISKIVNNKKIDLKGFFRLLIDTCNEPERGIPIDIVRDTADVAFVDILNERERHIFKDALDINEDGVLDPEEMLDTLKTAMTDIHDKIQMHFYYRACILDKRKVATEDYFFPYGLYKKTEYTEADFTSPAMRSLNFSREEAILCFDVLADKSKTIIGYDIIDCVESFRKLKNLEAKCGEPHQKFPPKKPTIMPNVGAKKPEPQPVGKFKLPRTSRPQRQR